MDVRKVFPSSLYRKSKRDQSANAGVASSPPQNAVTSPVQKPTMPITIPRRKAVRPPPCSPIRQQPSPDIVFNFDFSFSPCSFQGHGQIIARKDDWAPQTQFLQQRGRTSILLAQQCHQQQKALCGLTRRSSSTRRGAEALYCSQPLRHGLLAQALRTNERAYSQGPGGYMEDEASEDLTNCDRDIVESEELASAYASPVSSGCSSVVFAAPPRDAPSPGKRRRYEDEEEGFADPGLTSAFQRSVGSASVSARSTSPVPSSFSSPAPPMLPALPSPPTTSRTPSAPSSPSFRRPLRPLFPHNRSSMHLRTAAEPVVCLKVAEADRPARTRGRSPYPDTGRMFRARRTSSVGSRPTVTTLGRTRSSLVLSNEELERSLEKEDHREERGCGLEHGPDEMDEKEMIRGWELEYERGRTRGRTRGRGIAVARAPPAHM
ncbi:uncharacterized protein C8Q71DRAFT_396547 [Rhodofomes roseus]|uniref:Uncharacterized protein n=1 Tax=Rhodofomes roseus TaxID=34475 RepID=A0ABQ8JZI2_9APHY|nr:uncharacterized protein C8Q71DRAFT_396547 [Rhodofomes roseus]KAH9829659.1 hypothetical protein C8Q71DRAFT_396547 [Rhodofomes roseus]